jgi:hypothetical protein
LDAFTPPAEPARHQGENIQSIQYTVTFAPDENKGKRGKKGAVRIPSGNRGIREAFCARCECNQKNGWKKRTNIRQRKSKSLVDTQAKERQTAIECAY